MDIRPLHDRIVVRRIEEGEQTIGRIIVPDRAREKPQRGTVVSVWFRFPEETGAGDGRLSRPAGTAFFRQPSSRKSLR